MPLDVRGKCRPFLSAPIFASPADKPIGRNVIDQAGSENERRHLVTDKDKAEFIISGNAEHNGAGWAKTLSWAAYTLTNKRRSRESVESSAGVFVYPVNKEPAGVHSSLARSCQFHTQKSPAEPGLR